MSLKLNKGGPSKFDETIAVIGINGPFPILMLIIIVPILRSGSPDAVRRTVDEGDRTAPRGTADIGKTDLAAPESTTTAKLYSVETKPHEMTTLGSSAFTAIVVTARTGDFDDEAERDLDDCRRTGV